VGPISYLSSTNCIIRPQSIWRLIATARGNILESRMNTQSDSSNSPLSGFHPAIIQWFNARFAAPSAPQMRGWPAIRSGTDTVIAAPTGSGKTLAAFLSCIDTLLREAIEGGLPDETRVVYVSPLKALSNDVQKNLAEPLAEIGEVLVGMGLPAPEIRVMVRTGDTPASQRQAMTRKPPHILVTTPESLYILLTSDGGRRMLKTVKTVIVDEIHAVAGSKRGSHLSLSLERLDALAIQPPLRIALSATIKPIEEIARFFLGTERIDSNGGPRCAIIDEGYRRQWDLSIEMPGIPLSAVCSNETWEEIYHRLAELIMAQRTTLVFVNTRRMAERLTFHLTKILGEEHITSHHGSLSRDQRLKAEQRLKAGQLKALVATASLELGIDIGGVDLVCQIGSPRSISTFLQRVGRSGHSLDGTPQGRLFPLTRDDLVECAALLSQVRQGVLDKVIIPEKPLDILSQQIVAAVAAEEWDEDKLFQLCLRAYPYRNLTREEFDETCRMLSEGFSTRRGRSGAYLHYDSVGHRFRGRRGARLAAITSGGAIPDNADYDVILEPQNTFIGTVNEDFAVESMAGNIFQLGVSSWRIVRVEPGKVRVEDAHGLPPTIPFWLGEAPSRTAELSAAVSWLREGLGRRCLDPSEAASWLLEEIGVDGAAAQQIIEYIAAGMKTLGAVPTYNTIVLERFFDQSGGMQLVVHAPFGGRINRAWGLALRKRFCVTFNFELQAAANDDAIVLSLGPQHSFPLDEVFSYLHPNSVEDVLIQALLAVPVFGTRWRWNASRALAIPRWQGGRKMPMPLQRMKAEDLLAAVFPDSLACQEHIVGPIDVPDHLLVRETVKDCLHEAMDVDGLIQVISAIVENRVELVARDTVEPSAFAHEILTAKPWAFLDDAPLEERRTQAVATGYARDVDSAEDLGRLDPEAIQRVREQAWPEVENADELHDALLIMGYLTEEEGAPWRDYFLDLLGQKRATSLEIGASHRIWIACELTPVVSSAFPYAMARPPVQAPERELAILWSRESALQAIIRGRLEALGPVTAGMIAASLGVEQQDVLEALSALESEGFALRGRFSPGDGDTEWCDRRLLARIHRYTLDRLRQEISPVSAAEFINFLMAWQHVAPDHRLDGKSGLIGVLEILEGYEAPVTAWDQHLLPARLRHYTSSWIEELCLSGELAWARLHPSIDTNSPKTGATRSSPIAFLFREDLPLFLSLSPLPPESSLPLSGVAQDIKECLQERGACFFADLVHRTRQLPVDVEEGLKELIAWGLATCDGFTGLLSLTSPVRRQPLNRRISYQRERSSPSSRFLPRRNTPGDRTGSRFAIRPVAGRWSLLQRSNDEETEDREHKLECIARGLLRRYGVVFPRLLMRETEPPPWRDLIRVYRRLEARGEVRGGRFVAGFSGEQYALPEAVQLLRSVRKKRPDGALITVNGADPLNLVGILTPGQRVPAVPSNHITYRDGVPISVRSGGNLVSLEAQYELDNTYNLSATGTVGV